MKKILPIFIVIIAVVGAGSFYGGMKYQESKTPQRPTAGNFQNLQNLSPEERQQRLQQFGVGGQGNRAQSGGGFIGGEIIGKDAQSITVKSNDGSSKIVFFSNTTKIMKSAEGSPSDLATGKQVSVNGKTNQDGSITAETIQLRQATSTP